MKYMGSKNRIAKYLLPIILKNRKSDQWYVEPFVGGANMIDKVDGKRIGNDNNKYLVALLKYMQSNDDLQFPHIGEEEYKRIQNNKDNYPDWLVGYVGFNLSFGAKFFGGYRRDKKGIRNYENEAQQNLKAQQNKIKNIVFYNMDYFDFYEYIPLNSIVYCDPPYCQSTGYKSKINYKKFWEWCRIMSEYNQVFISEYNAPDDFKYIWSKEIYNSLTENTGAKKGIEKLFIYKNCKY